MRYSLTLLVVAGVLAGCTSRSDQEFAELQTRGQAAMGVDQYTSTHKFDDLADGGRIELQRNENDPRDVATILGGSLLFGAGVVLSYLYVLPLTLEWFRNYALGMGLDPRWQARDYFSFVTHLSLACGLLAELPVAVLALAVMRMVSFKLLSDTRPYAVTLILILVAIISPTPDPITFLALATPVVMIYEACIWLVWLMERRRTQEVSAKDFPD